jgi:hypothetical protein
MFKEAQSSLPDVQARRVNKAIKGIRASFSGVLHGSPRSEALIDKAMLLKSYTDNADDEKIAFVKDKIFRREEESGEYACTSHELAILIQETCFSVVNNKKEIVGEFSKELNLLLGELYAEDYEEASNRLLNLHGDTVKI